jgi:NAD(P)-dependent dehydrogenase (short-subunit alcohol dehydrogenase family)
MSILRPACYKLFSSLISSIYDRFEIGSGAPKQNLTVQSDVEDFLMKTIVRALGEGSSAGLKIDTDLFAFGVDSLTATRVRNEIVKGLELGDVKLGQNVVYEQPSITLLAQYLLKLSSTIREQDDQGNEAVYRDMLQLVETFSSQLSEQTQRVTNGTEPDTAGAVVVLTGATGSLGAHVLDRLTRRDDVSRVICLSRASNHSESLKRIHESLSLRQRVLTPSALAKITSLAADVGLDNLGLSHEEVSDVSANATHIIHNAWPVNFNLSLQSFVPHIQGAVNLIKLAQSARHKARFYFSSSVGTRQGRPDALVKEEFPDSPVTAGGMGYGRSKWVVEKIMEKVKGIQVGVLRIGQLVGDTKR